MAPSAKCCPTGTPCIAEDADRLETELQKAQTDLAAVQAANAQTTADLAAAKTQAEALQKELEAARAQLAQLKTASETQSAELKKQIDSEKQRQPARRNVLTRPKTPTKPPSDRLPRCGKKPCVRQKP